METVLIKTYHCRSLKARAFRESCNSRNNSRLLKTIEKRFVLLIVAFPLCFGTILGTLSVYNSLFKEMISAYFKYVSCLNQPSQNHTCPPDHQKYHSIATCIVDLVIFDIYSIVLMASTLLPAPARQFWRRQLARIVRCYRKVPTGDAERTERRTNRPTHVIPSGERGSCSRNTHTN